MDEWIHEGIPPYGSKAQVWLSNGSVREVESSGLLWFTDCRDPMQNVYCEPKQVAAWRYIGPRPSLTFADQMRALGAAQSGANNQAPCPQSYGLQSELGSMANAALSYLGL